MTIFGLSISECLLLVLDLGVLVACVFLFRRLGSPPPHSRQTQRQPFAATPKRKPRVINRTTKDELELSEKMRAEKGW